MNTYKQRQTDVWEKWDWLWNTIFYGTVLISVWLMLRDDNRAAEIWVPALLTVVLLLWHWGGLRLIYRDVSSPDERALARFVIIMGDITLWFLLVTISPAYYFALFGLFGQVFRHLPIRYATTAILFLTAAIIFEQVADSGESFALTNPTLWPYLFMGVAGIILGSWVTAIIEQSMSRRQLIEQLEEAQAELAAAERRAGVLEERQRLAREIHDTLAQGFTSIVMHLEAAEQALPDDLGGAQKYLDQARVTARVSLDQARRVVQDLRPDLLEQHSLPNAIERVAARWRAETGLDLTTSVTGDPLSLHPNIEVTLLRAAQEALNNVRKHAQATDVQLTLSYMTDAIVLDVQDNGVGLAGAELSQFSGGYGLQAMRERAAQCGGFMTLESDLGEGTTLVVSIPLSGQTAPVAGKVSGSQAQTNRTNL
jgi:signal transduction histidine kinase